MGIIIGLYIVIDVCFVIYGVPHVLRWIKFPTFSVDLFMYGKTRGDSGVQTALVKFIEVPKSWFKHFYAYGLLVSIYMAVLTVGTFYLGLTVPGAEFVQTLIDRTPVSVDKHAATLVTLMMLMQHIRRLYESLFVSVYSKGTMNLVHYFVGFFLYSTVQLCAISGVGSLRPSRDDPFQQISNLDGASLQMLLTNHWNKVLGVVIFLWASFHHSKTHTILANLRKDRTGTRVLHRQHVIPRGGSFTYLSAPHFVYEICLYLAMGLVCMQNPTMWWGPVLFVVINQGLMSVETHQWYKKTFKEYPQNRYALIPGIY